MSAPIPPHDLAVERAVLGACLLSRESLGSVLSHLTAGDFYKEGHRTIFDRMNRLCAAGKPVDLLTLSSALQDAGELSYIGGPAELAGLSEEAATATNVDAYVTIIIEAATRRELIELADAVSKGAREGAHSQDLLGSLMARANRLSRRIATAETEGPLVVLASSLTAPDVLYRVESLVPDEMLTLLSGKDKRGKTLLAQEIVRAVLTGVPLFGQLPVRRGPVVAAFLDDPLSITISRLETLGIRQHPQLHLVSPLRYDGDPIAFLGSLEAEAKQLGAGLVVVDALYLLAPTTRDAGNDSARMTPLMRRLDQLAAEVRAATLVVAHDNKSGVDVAGSYVVRAMAKSILRLALPRSEEQGVTDGPPTTRRRVLTVESKLIEASAHMLELRAVGEWVRLGAPEAVRVNDVKAAMATFLTAQTEPLPQKEIYEAVEGRHDVKWKGLDELRAEQLVSRSGAGKKGDPYLYLWAANAPQTGGQENSIPRSSLLGRGMESKTDLTSRFSSSDSIPGPSGDRNGSGDSISAPAWEGAWPPCRACGGRNFWGSVTGKAVCAQCQPPAAPELVAATAPAALAGQAEARR